MARQPAQAQANPQRTYLDNLLMAVFLINTALIKNANTRVCRCVCEHVSTWVCVNGIHKHGGSQVQVIVVRIRQQQRGKKDNEWQQRIKLKFINVKVAVLNI